ncbi:PREDICTED: putative nuclease HARBI1 isoform X1 [Tarenaya hassleriana]|uniref:putative nuclease HARBI1 isoform X1 n=1 Tax=Tarenaya hassleriana TaxID=28532 RepID=UPI00053C973A|nr:PREDICTED: putative nuclease HARBI1 isoform X1 [Tarenaya hassleriana]
MRPLKGIKKRKRVAEKKVDQNVLAAAAPATALRGGPPLQDWWDEFSQRISGPLLDSKDPKTLESILKVSRKTFNYICSLVKDDFTARPANFSDSNGKPLSLNDRVAIALRRLGSGESLSIIGESFGMNQSTVSQITWRFVESMEERGLKHLSWPAKSDEVKSKFEKISGLPNCCGAIDITHIVMNLPAVEPSNKVWLDDEKNYSMILQATVDPDMRFLDVIAGWPGSLSDEVALRNSGFYRLAEKGKRLDGEKLQLSEGTELREYIVGDSGFPLLPWLLTPYQGKPMSNSQMEFNKRHSETRKVAQMALARLKDKWRIINGVMWMPDRNRLPRIILVCCLLHNILIDMDDKVLDDLPVSHQHDMSYKQRNCKFVDEAASIMRDKLCHHLWGKVSEA